MRHTIRLASILALCSLAVGSAQAQQRLGVAAEARLGTSPLTKKPSVLVTFTNKGRHDVTAYNYSLRIDFADGTSSLDDRGTEFEPSQLRGNQLFVSGATRVEDLFELSDILNKNVTRVVATVDMVAYDDGSAEVINEAAFRRLVESRKAEAVAREKVDEVLKQALSADDPQQAALDGLKKLAETYAAKKDRAPEESHINAEIQFTIINISQNHRKTSRDEFQSYLEYHEDRLALAKVHSNVRRIN
jgi:hypothetical protein